MAGRGPAPKALEQRRNHHEPIRGEWTAIRTPPRAVLPALPANDEWSPRTRAAWAVWRKDPATSMYGPAEIQFALDMAYLYEEWVTVGGSKLAGEIRQRQDGLGLTLKGKQDRHWRVTTEPEADESMADVVELHSLPAVS